MRSIWSGSLVFGLVNVPVKVYAATEDNDIRFHQLHSEDGGRIRYQRRCELCEKVVPFADIAKGYESDDGQTVIVTDEDLKTLPTNSEREISLLSFVPSDQIDPVLFDKSYYLEPASKSPKAYVLLREVLAETDRVAVVHFALRQKTRLAVLRVTDDVLLVQTLLWPDEVRQVSFPVLDQPINVAKAEKDMATMLIKTYSDDFHPEAHEDTYRMELQQLIDAKLSGGEAFSAHEDDEGEDAEVLDLLAALQRSVEAHRSAGGKGADSATTQAGSKARGSKAEGSKNEGSVQDSAGSSKTASSATRDDDSQEQSPRKPAARATAATSKKKPAAKKTSAAGENSADEDSAEEKSPTRAKRPRSA